MSVGSGARSLARAASAAAVAAALAARPDRRAGTWLESPEYAAFKAYDPRQARPKTKRDTPVALLDYLNAHGSVFRKAGITAKKPKKKKKKKATEDGAKKKPKKKRDWPRKKKERPVIRPPAAA